MIESDIFKADSAKHHGQHHGASDPDVHSGGIDIPISDSPHEADEHSHHEDESEPTERKTTMKDTTAPTLIALALAVISIFGLAAGNAANAATIGRIEIANDIADGGIAAIALGNIKSNILKEDIAETINITNSINRININDELRPIAGVVEIVVVNNAAMSRIDIGDLIRVGSDA